MTDYPQHVMEWPGAKAKCPLCKDTGTVNSMALARHVSPRYPYRMMNYASLQAMGFQLVDTHQLGTHIENDFHCWDRCPRERKAT